MPVQPNQVHRDAVLSTFATMYKNPRLIYDQVVSMLRVVKASDRFARYSKADVFALADSTYIAGGQANEINARLDLDGLYSTREYGLAGYVLDRTVRNADNPIQPRLDQTRLLTDQLMLGRERRVAQLIFNPASYPSSHVETLAGNAQWTNAASDPVGDIQTAIRTPLMKPNVLMFGAEAWDGFRRHEKVLRAISGATLSTGADPAGGMATRAQVAALYEVQSVVVGEARWSPDDFQQNTTGNLQFIWGKHVSALYVEPTMSGPDTLTHAALFYTMPLEIATAYRLERKGEYVVGNWDEDLQVIAPDVGYHLRDVVA